MPAFSAKGAILLMSSSQCVLGGDFKASKFLNDLAVGIGVGIRYDLDFFVLRLDWGYALHAPYETSKGGYFNIPSFSKSHCLNFAIGYPF